MGKRYQITPNFIHGTVTHTDINCDHNSSRGIITKCYENIQYAFEKNNTLNKMTLV